MVVILKSIADTELSGGFATTNYGSTTTMAVGRGTVTTSRRSLIAFDLSTDAVAYGVQSATLRCYVDSYDASAGTRAFEVRRLRRADWVESEATWSIYKTGSSWDGAGASNTTTDLHTTPVATYTTPASPSAGWVEWDVTTQVQDALVGGRYDLRINGDESVSNTCMYIRTNDYPGDLGEFAPQLVITPKHHNLGDRQIYERPKTIVGQKIRLIRAKLHTYSVEDTARNIFDGDIRLTNTTTQEVTIQHPPCEVDASPAPLTVNSGGTLAVSPEPVYRTYSTTFTVNPTATTVNVTLVGYPVEIGSRLFEKTYDSQGEILEFECPIGTDPTLVEAMIDHYHATASATRYEVAVRDDPALQVGDRILLELPLGREGATLGYIPTVLTQIKRSYTGAQDAVYTLVTDVTT